MTSGGLSVSLEYRLSGSKTEYGIAIPHWVASSPSAASDDTHNASASVLANQSIE
jgi:hypothetical protein